MGLGYPGLLNSLLPITLIWSIIRNLELKAKRWVGLSGEMKMFSPFS